MSASVLFPSGLDPVVAGSAAPSEGEANQELAALDQGLRCPRLGEQSEAIVRFPSLFTKYPFPILINSALLKLADVFRQGSNFIRLSVLRVLQESDRHLDKITNVDEFVKRIFTVLHSNDPVARALTLRTLGSIAVIIPERKQVHHNIRNALDSHDTVEVLAAIYAAGQFSAHSKNFSVTMCSKLGEMLTGYAMPLNMKRRLVPIFQHMHHDAKTAQTARTTCTSMLPGYPSSSLTLPVLHTLTLLSARTLVDVPDQVELLLKYLNEDARNRVKSRVLRDLRHLAAESRAHLWSEANVASLVAFSSEAVNNGAGSEEGEEAGEEMQTLCGALSVLCELVKHTGTEKLDLTSHESPILKLTAKCCYCLSLPVVARSTQLLTLIAAKCKRDLHHVDGVDVSSEAVMSIEALFLLVNSGAKFVNLNVLKECLHCVVDLCHVESAACDQFVDVVGGLLASSVASPDTMSLLCQLLASLANLRAGVLKLLLPDICNAMAAVDASSRTDVPSLLCTLLLQTLKGHTWPENCTVAVQSLLARADLWTGYRVARAANRYGHHALAATVYAASAGRVSSEQNYFWLTGLAQVSRGEAALNQAEDPDLIERISEGNAEILLGVSSITAATTQAKSQEFQIQYLKCRSEMLTCLSQLVSACHSLRTSPPPAIASAQAKNSNDDLQRCGRITLLFRESVKDFERVGQMYADLASASFDADPDSLALLGLQGQLAVSMGQWIEMVCLKSSLQGNIYADMDRIEFSEEGAGLGGKDERGIELQGFLAACTAVAKEFHTLWRNPDATPISHLHTDCLLRVCALLASAPLPLPRFFFQSIQQTSLKLAVTPQPRSVGEPVAVCTTAQLAVKVEGVITSGCQLSRPWRRVAAVHTTLTSSLVNAAKSAQMEYNQGGRKLPDCAQRLEQRTEPHNDFFSCQFLIPFPLAGTHQVSIETQFEDAEGRFWRTGQNININVKAFEDANNRNAAGQIRPTQQMPGTSR